MSGKRGSAPGSGGEGRPGRRLWHWVSGLPGRPMEAESTWGRRLASTWYALATLSFIGGSIHVALEQSSLVDQAIPVVVAIAVLVTAAVRLRRYARRSRHTAPPPGHPGEPTKQDAQGDGTPWSWITTER